MRALFRGLMVPVSFLLFLAIFAGLAVAVIAAGPVLIDGMAPQALPTLLPQGGGKPSPYVIAAGVAAVDALLIGMIAMLVSEKVDTVGGFVRSLVKTAVWFAILTAGPLAVWLHGQDGTGWTRYAPAILLAAGLLAAALGAGIVLGKPFLWWVSERPVDRRRRPATAVVTEVPATVPMRPQAPAAVPPPVAVAPVEAAPLPSPPPARPAVTPAEPAEAPKP